MSPFTRPRGLLLSLLALSLLAVRVPSEAATESPKPLEYIDGVPDTGQFLPNSETLARVADRRISVYAFRNAYFASDPKIRPAADSAGRAEFLTNMVRKDVLGLTALAAGYPMNFEDRARMREHRANVLSNRLFETAVLGTPPVPEDSLRRVHEFQKRDLRMRMLYFTDRAEAEAAHRALATGKAKWEALAARHTPPGLREAGGLLDWARFDQLPMDLSLRIWHLKPGGISTVVPAGAGYQVLQVAEERPRPMPVYEIMRPAIKSSLENYAAELRRRVITDEAKQGMNVRYDTTNVKWAAGHYFQAVQMGSEGGGQNIVIDENVPEFGDSDTSRTILTWDGGRITLGHLAHEYAELPAVMRPAINTPDGMMDYADAIMLAPRMVDLAVARGLEQDPVVVARLEHKREEILVMKMVEDSCFARIMVSPRERREYYEKNRNGFVTFPRVRAAFLVRDTQAGADSVRARLAAGEPVRTVLQADSLRGEMRSGTKEISANDRDPMHKVLFEEMRPGQSRVMGPDRQGLWACIHLVEFDPGQQLPFESVQGVVDESVRNLKSEQALNAFVERLMKRYAVEARYDLLPRVKLVTPAPDESE